jgi:iron-sulfur cluster repair protein YtfE (RIC family)
MGPVVALRDTSRVSVTEPLRREHRELMPSIEALAQAADAAGSSSLPALRERVNGSHAFLAEHLIPHAEAEDQVLYPAVDRLIGDRNATRPTDTMRRDHVEVARLTEDLGSLRAVLQAREPTASERRELQRILYGLHALVSVHFAKEEEVYLPLLDRELSADEAGALFAEMENVKPVSSAHGQEPSGPHSAEERQ